MWEDIKKILTKAINKLYPQDITCLICGNELKFQGDVICKKCENDIEFIVKPCLKCGSPCHSMADYCLNCQSLKRSFKFARAPFVYSGEIARIIQSFKYRGNKHLAYPLAQILKKELYKMLASGEIIDAIIYVPLYKTKQKKRGYNQSELIANELSKLTEIPLISNNLIRIKDTLTQTNLTHKERQRNLEKAFLLRDGNEIKGKNILLIDDVLTTGSTADHCAQVLKKAKARDIYVLTVAIPDIENSINKAE